MKQSKVIACTDRHTDRDRDRNTDMTKKHYLPTYADGNNANKNVFPTFTVEVNGHHLK